MNSKGTEIYAVDYNGILNGFSTFVQILRIHMYGFLNIFLSKEWISGIIRRFTLRMMPIYEAALVHSFLRRFFCLTTTQRLKEFSPKDTFLSWQFEMNRSSHSEGSSKTSAAAGFSIKNRSGTFLVCNRFLIAGPSINHQNCQSESYPFVYQLRSSNDRSLPVAVYQ